MTSESLICLEVVFITVLSKVDDFANFSKVELHVENSTFWKVEIV